MFLCSVLKSRRLRVLLHSVALAAALCSVAPSLVAQETLQTYTGNQASDFLGAEVACVGDIDGDFSQDFAITATGDSSFAGLITFISGATHQAITTLASPDPGATFGSRIIELRDVNVDGHTDIVVASPNYGVSAALSGLGRVRLYSGKWVTTGQGPSVLADYTAISFAGNPTTVGDFLGSSLENLGDLDGDFRDDYAIGARDLGGPGYVLLKSSLNPLVGLGVLTGNANGDFFGSAVANLGDLDNDGDREVAIGASQQDNGGAGYVEVFDLPGTAAPMYSLFGVSPGDRFGAAMDWMFSITPGDFENELIVGAPGGNYVKVFDGQTGAELFRFDGDGPADLFGEAVASIPDWNGDGLGDILVGAPGNGLASGNPKPGYVRCFSGLTGEVLFTLQGDDSTAADGASDQFGAALASLTDISGDFKADFVVGVPRDDDGGADAGSVRLVSGRAPAAFLSVDNTELSMAAGGTVNFTLYNDAAQVGVQYLVAGSLSGAAPGFDFQGFHIPLNIDSYFNLTVSSPNVPVGGDGFVSSTGIDTASFTFTPNQYPNLAGSSAHHAFVLLQGGVQAVSNSVSTVFNN